MMTLHSAKGLEFPVVFLCGHGRRPVPAPALDHRHRRASRKSAACATSARRARCGSSTSRMRSSAACTASTATARRRASSREIPAELLEEVRPRIQVSRPVAADCAPQGARPRAARRHEVRRRRRRDPARPARATRQVWRGRDPEPRGPGQQRAASRSISSEQGTKWLDARRTRTWSRRVARATSHENTSSSGPARSAARAAYHLAREEGERRHRRRHQRRAAARPAGPHRHPHRRRQRVAARARSKRRARDADMLIALTNSDEVNMVACQIAWTPVRHARPRSRASVRATTPSSEAALEHRARRIAPASPSTCPISPEQLVTDYIERLIQLSGRAAGARLRGRPGAAGRHQGAARAARWSASSSASCATHMPEREARVAAIYRNGRSIKPDGDTGSSRRRRGVLRRRDARTSALS